MPASSPTTTTGSWSVSSSDAGGGVAAGQVEPDRSVGRQGVRVERRVGDDGQQVDRGAVEGTAGVEPGQQQQVVDEPAHAGGLGLDAAEEPGRLRGRLLGALTVQLGEAADRREGGAQLVAGVGDELPHAVLRRARLALGRLAGADRGLDLREHGVQGARQPAHLGVLRGVGDAPREVAGGDGLRRLLDGGERPQAQPHHDGAEQGEHHQDTHADEQLDVGHAGHRLVDVAEAARGRERVLRPGPVEEPGGAPPATPRSWSAP